MKKCDEGILECLMQDICLLSPRASARNGTMRRMMEFGGYFRCNLSHEQVADNVG